MGQKVNPIGFRTGIRLGWKSTWFSPKADYGDFLVEDQKIRRYIDVKYNQSMPKGAVAKTEIVRTSNEIKVTLHSARPGIIIGPRGGEVDKLREDLEAFTGKKVNVNVIEIKCPELNAKLVADAIAEQLTKRASFRRAMKQHCENAINAGAKGVKIMCSGRLAGSEMARKETQKMGSIPLHTLDANVDYALSNSRTTYGIIGVKVWIYKGKFGEEIEAKPMSRGRGRGRGPRGAAPRGGSPRGAGASRQSKRSSVQTKDAAEPAKTPAAPQENTDANVNSESSNQ